jgi:CRISPR/Cas system-associated endonuclease/helicase Cas3
VVFSTATQPAFGHLDTMVRQYCAAGWQPQEIVPSELRLFERARRVRVEWPKREERIGWGHLVGEFCGLRQVLCIVNLKRHARDLFQLLVPQWGDDAFHLSTAMCPKHRAAVLERVRMRLKGGFRCALVATQCVEAGVDLDFPAAFRALGPLDSIAQAAGRCNRNGKLEAGFLRVFIPEDPGYPRGVYAQATDLTEALLYGDTRLSVDDPRVFEKYFQHLYSVATLEDRSLREAIQTKHFPDVRKYYHIIEEDNVNVLVAYDRARYEELAEEVRRDGLSRDWVRRARPYAVSCYREEARVMEGVPLKDRAPSGDWFLYDRNYDSASGLKVPKELEFLGA